MTLEFNIIGDIAGQYKTLEALLKKMPPSAIPFSVGDMVDRGPQSKDVLYFFKEYGQAILGNHEHLMLTDYQFATKKTQTRYYDTGLWLQNGGTKTLISLLGEEFKDKILDLDDKFYTYVDRFYEDPIVELILMRSEREYDELMKLLPSDLMSWIESLPLYFETSDLFVSHAPVRSDWAFEKVLDLGTTNNKTTDECIIWNRGSPRRMPNQIQIFGHNSYRNTKYFADKQGNFAIGIDTSRSDILTGIHYPSMQIFQQEYL